MGERNTPDYLVLPQLRPASPRQKDHPGLRASRQPSSRQPLPSNGGSLEASYG